MSKQKGRRGSSISLRGGPLQVICSQTTQLQKEGPRSRETRTIFGFRRDRWEKEGKEGRRGSGFNEEKRELLLNVRGGKNSLCHHSKKEEEGKRGENKLRLEEKQKRGFKKMINCPQQKENISLKLFIQDRREGKRRRKALRTLVRTGQVRS